MGKGLLVGIRRTRPITLNRDQMIKYIPYILSFIYIFIATTSVGYLGTDFSDKDINNTGYTGYILLPISILLTGLLLRDWVTFKKIIIDNKILFMLIALFIISCFWSDNRWVALKMFIKFLGMVVSIITIMLYNKNNLWKFLTVYIVTACSISLILIALFPDIGLMVYDDGSFLPRGVFSHKNSLGIFGILGCLICFYNYLKTKNYYHLFISLICLFLLLASKSATAILALVASLCFYFAFKLIKNKIWVFVMLLTLLICFVLLLYSVPLPNLLEAVFNKLGKDSSLTGRDVIWPMLIKIGMQQPVFGFGYGSFFRGDETLWVSNLIGWKAFHAHNGFLQIFLETGLVGLSIVVVFLIDLILRMIKSKNYKLLFFLPTIFVYNFSEAGLFNIGFMPIFIVGLFLFTKVTINNMVLRELK
jgi:O-antigen ligase